jgi:hypothetical protein
MRREADYIIDAPQHPAVKPGNGQTNVEPCADLAVSERVDRPYRSGRYKHRVKIKKPETGSVA